MLEVLTDLPRASFGWRDTFAQKFPKYEPDPLYAEKCLPCDIRNLNATPLRVTAATSLVMNVHELALGEFVEVGFWFTLFSRRHGDGFQHFPQNWTRHEQGAVRWLEQHGFGQVDNLLTNLTPQGGRLFGHPHSQFLVRPPTREVPMTAGVGLVTAWLRMISQQA